MALLFCAIQPVFAEDSIETLGFIEPSTIVSTSRVPRPISQTAENIMVITADDIARLNAHTLDEVLQTASGIQLFQLRTPGSTALFTLNGSLSNNVMVLIDGVPQNLLGADFNAAELGMIPVQRIERIEIIKGAASVAWGPALGGAVNIITRDPETDKKLKGIASISYGESSTSDLRGGMSGTSDRFGYYFDGGKFHSNGLLPDNQTTLDHVFGKLTYRLPGKGRVTFGVDYREGDREQGKGDKAHGLGDTLLTAGSQYKSAYLNLDYPLYDQLHLELFSSAGQKEIWLKYTMPGPLLIIDGLNQTDSKQASAKLTWSNNSTNLVAGFEFLRDDISVSEPKTGLSYLNFKRDLKRYGAYVNGSYSVGPVTLLPGIRSDQISSNEQVTSYNFGATWQLSENTLLRAYAAKGYSLPTPSFFQDSQQNIWTVQTGIESKAIPYLWLKGTIFYSNTWNIQTYVVPPDFPASPVTTVKTEEIRKGFEIEGRSNPWHDLTLAAGYMHSDVLDRNTETRITLVPIATTKLSLQYSNHQSGLNALLAGSYVNWPSGAGNDVHDRQIYWDLHLSQKLPEHGGVTPELFFSWHNLFDNAQYLDDFRTNAPRWFEGGLRVSF